MTIIHIGHDISLIEDGAHEESARVYVESNNGEVSITCAWGDAWAGYARLRAYLDDADADLIAKAIAADPVAELTRLGYDCAGWFVPIKTDVPVFTTEMIEAIYAAWHGAGVDIAGGNWDRFIGMLTRR